MDELNFSTLWVSGPISGYEALSFQSFKRSGLRHVIYSYEPNYLAALKTEVRDAEEIISRTDPIFGLAASGQFALFSDIFRYRLLEKRATVWVDTDIVVVNPDQFPFGQYVFGFEDPLKVNVAVLSAPQQSALLKDLAHQAQTLYSEGDPKWGIGGPDLLTNLISKHGLWGHVSSIEVFYPLLYNEVWKLFSPELVEEIQERVSDSFSLHLWNEVLRGPNGERKRFLPPEDSFLHFLVEKYDVGDFFEARVPESFFDISAMMKAQNSTRFRLRMMIYYLLGTVHWGPLRIFRPFVYSLRKWTRI